MTPSTPALAHSVFISLHDNSPAARAELLADCDRLLGHHPGTLFYWAGELAGDIAWEVSERDFDVALHLIFENKAAHDVYQDSADHVAFLHKHEANLKSIRVFDAYR